MSFTLFVRARSVARGPLAGQSTGRILQAVSDTQIALTRNQSPRAARIERTYSSSDFRNSRQPSMPSDDSLSSSRFRISFAC